MNDTAPTRRTKRRYAAELYPHAGENEIRPLAVEVPYLYACAIGLNVMETDWFEVLDREGGVRMLAIERTNALIHASHLALLADALAQDLGGQDAWDWAGVRYSPDSDWIWERAEHYGVPIEQIKPYPVIEECSWHYHHVLHESGKFTHSIRIQAPESECNDCTEPVEELTQEERA